VPSDSILIARRIEARLDWLAGCISWIWLALIALIVLTVVLRYVFGAGRIDLEELQWHFYAVGFLSGLFACAAHDRHVRVDVFRERMSPRTRAWVDLYGILLLQIPFLALVLWSAVPFVIESFIVNEQSASAGGLAYRWILKAFLPISIVLLAIATSTRLLRVLDALFGRQASEGAA
jgi:TRAP-type mannitol/chloroaromatic compound transport system permease small subunit